MPINFETGDWEDEVLDKEEIERLIPKKVDSDGNPKKVDPNSYVKASHNNMAYSLSSKSPEAINHVEQVLKNSKKPEVIKIHEDYDKLLIILNSYKSSKEQKQSAARRMAELAIELKEHGAVIEYHR